MYIRSIRLRDWKSYVDGNLIFPGPSKKKNIVLIGARNGYGKSSLLEAIMLCLYGRDGLRFIGRATDANGVEDKLKISYDDFLSRTLHARALEQGRSSTSVEIALEDEGEQLRIVRRWHFSNNGRHRPADEEVQIFVGVDEDPLRIPRLEDREEFLRGYIAQHFLPVDLAQFFLFDGEQVQRLAKRDMGDQVRAGIEGLLGVGLLRELQSDLRSYATSRRSSVPKIGDETLERLRAEIEELEGQNEDATTKRQHLDAKLEPIRRRRDTVRKDIGALTGGNFANLKELIEEKSRYERQIDRLREDFSHLLKADLALALTGNTLRSRLGTQLHQEAARQRWVMGRDTTKDALKKLQDGLSAKHPPLSPKLTASQLATLKERLRVAWESLWHPPPDDCAKETRHAYLGDAERSAVLKRLEDVETIGVSSITDLLSDLGNAEAAIRRLDSQIASLSGIEDQVKKLTDELEELHRQDRSLTQEISDLRRTEDATQGQLGPKRAQLANQAQSHKNAAPRLTQAAYADQIADLIDSIAAELYPMRIRDVARAMTAIYRGLAHKNLVRSIEISDDCSVRLLGDNGFDMRSFDNSAGEDQIFALSLIGAIAKSAGVRVPVVMDTPLARLDTEHRLNVLQKFVAQASHQVILLAQPDEIHGQYLKAIRDKIGASYQLEFEELGNGVGVNRIRQGYFGEV